MSLRLIVTIIGLPSSVLIKISFSLLKTFHRKGFVDLKFTRMVGKLNIGVYLYLAEAGKGKTVYKLIENIRGGVGSKKEKGIINSTIFMHGRRQVKVRSKYGDVAIMGSTV